MAGIKDYSTTASNNSSVGGVTISEGMIPSNINDSLRAILADVREWYNDSQWIVYGDGDAAFTIAYASATTFTIASTDVTTFYHVGRRVKAVGSSTGTIYGTISATTFSTNTTVTVVWDSGSLQNESIAVSVGALSATNNIIPEGIISTAKLVDGSVTTAKIAADAVNGTKIADDSIDSEHYVDGSIDTAHIADAQITTAKVADANITTAKILDANVTTAKIADSNITTAKINDNAVTSDKIADAVLITNSEVSGSTPDDVTLFTTLASDTRYFRQDSSETIDSGDSWSASDSFIATTAAIDARVIDLVDDVGGFFPITNETSFPNTNPDINDGAGTIVSIQAIASTRTPNAGTVTISGGTIGGSTVTITGCGSTVLTAGFGVLVETSTTLNTYTFHRLTPKATEVTTVASISADITTVSGDTANIGTIATDLNGDDNIGTVATNITNVNNVGGSITNVNTVANNLSGVNSFAERYRVESSDPTGSLDEGDLAFNTTDNNLKFYNGTSWTAISPGIANVVEDTTPQLGGNLDLNSNNIDGTGNINITGSLTGTTFSGSGASLTNIPNGALDNNSITINGSAISLGGSVTIEATLPTITSISPDTITNAATNVVITGTNFVITPNVEIISTTGAIILANTVTRDSATQLTINVTLPDDGTYFIRIENPDGGAVRSSTALLTVSDAPTWTTASGSLGSVTQGGAFSSTVVASSDSAITYSVQSGALPSGITLNTSTGVISGTESGSDSGETVYNFTLRATDAELQTADRAFSITVTVGINNGIQFN